MALKALPPAESIDPSECEAAQRISAVLRDEAGRMPSDSPLRDLALRSATRWGAVADRRPRLRVVSLLREEGR